MSSFVRTYPRRPLLFAAALFFGTSCVVSAAPSEQPRATVAVARTESVMTTEGLFNPTWLYPEGRTDYGVIAWLLEQAVAGAVGVDDVSAAWGTLLSPNDRVGIMIDVEGIQPHDPILEALIRQIMNRGIPMRNITIFAGEESALFRAGFDISGRTPGVRVMASDDQGYRNGLTRIVLNHCTKIVSVSRLRIDPQIGMYGALANSLPAVPYVKRRRMMRDPQQLPAAAAKGTMKRKVVMYIVDVLRPGFQASNGGGRYDTWPYNGVMASVDPVALDTIGRQIIGEKLAEQAGGAGCPPPDVPYLIPAAEDYRLGTADPEQIDVVRTGP